MVYYKNNLVINVIVEQKIILDWHEILTHYNNERRKHLGLCMDYVIHTSLVRYKKNN